jgi:hypothetical protein
MKITGTVLSRPQGENPFTADFLLEETGVNPEKIYCICIGPQAEKTRQKINAGDCITAEGKLSMYVRHEYTGARKISRVLIVHSLRKQNTKQI